MTTATRDLLKAFENLSEDERLNFAAEILRRTAHLDLPPPFDDDLITAAEELFLQLDEKEAESEAANTRS